MTRQLRIAILSGLFMLSFLAVNSSRAQTAPQQSGKTQTKKTPKPMPVMEQMTNIPYFTLRDGMSSTLTLNNLQASPTPVTVTIYNTEGKGQMLKPITLDPHSVKLIELGDVIVGDDFSSGNVEVAFNGISMAVTSQVSIYSLKNRVSFESREADMMDFESSRLAGILSLPRGADGFLAVTNAAMTRKTVQLTIGSKKKEISLFPRETNLVELNEGGDGARADTLVTLQHNGLPGDVIATGYVLNLKVGYSSAFTMSDPGNLRSGKLAGAHFRAGQPDRSEGFPEGTRFHSPLLLANVGANPVNAHVSVDYTVEESKDSERKGDDVQKDSGNTAKHTVAKVKDLEIAPGDVQRIELSDILGANHIAEAGVEIAYDGAPGALIGQLTSVDQTGDYSFEVPIKDPSDPSAMVESAYPWTIENGTNTVLHLKNTTEASVSALVLFAFPDGGGYSPDRIVLEPHQSIAIDIQKLKDSTKPDLLKRIFPSDVGHGQVLWHQETPSTMIGRAEQTNAKTGIARSFSCNSGCCDYYYWGSVILSPSSLTGAVGGGGSFGGLEDYWSCGDYHYTAYAANAHTWTTTASAVATVGSSGNVSYMGPGTATIEGDFHYNAYYWDVDTCRYDNLNDGYDSAYAQALSFTQIQHTYPANPLPYTCRITSFFDAFRNSKAHHAEDVVKNGGGTSYGDAVYAMEAGTVTAVASGKGPASSSYPTCAGTGALVDYVKIHTSDGYSTIYAHVTPSVSVNDTVTAGQQIGTLDNSGCQSGPHLHVARKNSSGTPVNFSIPCVNPTPTSSFDDGDVLDDISDSL